VDSKNYVKKRQVKNIKTVLKYPGAKNRIADWICNFIPEHGVYLEPFAGSLAVFFNKKPARIETINDLNGDVVNYFKVLRDKPHELIRRLKFTPFARDEYYGAYIENENDDDVERARKFAVKCWQGFGCSNLYRNGFRSSQQSNSPHCTKEWRGLPERLIAASQRLLNAQIENLPAAEIIKRYNTQDVFIYADPPYLTSTRKANLYKHEMTDSEHEELLNLLLKHPGKVIISGYDNEMYNEYLSGWHKEQRRTQAEAGIIRTETLWMNYIPEIKQMSLFK
jgi:DNA adenine methylase